LPVAEPVAASWPFFFCRITVTAPFFGELSPPPQFSQLLANALLVPLRPAFFITQLTNEEHHGTSSVVAASVVV
jgi:hypothetical protein